LFFSLCSLLSTFTLDSARKDIFGRPPLRKAGVPFVNVFDFRQQGQNWDAHHQNFEQHKGHLLPLADQSLSALIEDLDERGLLDTTLVVAMGEFGRTPRMNGHAGRDHWSDCFSVLLAGGGLQGGRIVAMGAGEFAKLGTPNNTGTRIVCVSEFTATSLDGVTFRVDDETRAEAQARAAAMADAKTKADALASAAGVSINGVISIAETVTPVPYPMPFAALDSAGGKSVPTPVQPGTNEVSVSVSVSVSSPTIQSSLIKHGLGSKLERLFRLEAPVASEPIEVSAEQMTQIEKANPCFRERHVESSRPGELLCRDTFLVGTFKGGGKV
jgi:hypothetical protein